VTAADDAALRLLLDEREIVRLLATFSRSLDTKDFDRYASLYAEDGELITPWGRHQGRAGMADHARNDLDGYADLQHVSTGHSIDVEGDRAQVRTSLLATHVVDESKKRFFTVGGHYDMTLVRVDGSWRFARVAIRPAWVFETHEGLAP
jgi:uncharacterized protein (TIGR02246 family)